MIGVPLWFPWVRFTARQVPGPQRRRAGTTGSTLRVACPHCTNVDTLTLHCPHAHCDWVHCSCGALIYNDRRHRHPRHGSDRDTCHDPQAAA